MGHTHITDFWEQVQPHRSYGIIAVALPKERIPEIPDWLRRLLRLPEFSCLGIRASFQSGFFEREFGLQFKNFLRIRDSEFGVRGSGFRVL